MELVNCPFCHRSMRDDSRERHCGNTGAEGEFINPNYFRMLNNSIPGSTTSSVPPSPRHRFVQPALPDGPTNTAPAQSSPPTQGISSAAFSPDYFKRFFVEERVLGKGGKGVVLLVKHVLDNVSLGHYACKRVPVGDDHEWLEKVLGEVQLLQHLSHQNLVSYRHVWLENAKISTFGPSVPCAFILQQYCNAGDLHDYICGSVQTSTTAQQLKDRLRRKSKGEPEPRTKLGGPRTLQLDEIYSFFRDITSGLRYLHANGYIHRDLKPNNCLLHETGDGIRVLVSDFGEVQSQNAMRQSTGATGTLSYCAPEVLRQEYPDGPFGNFTFKSDIFSLGMILYFLCFASLPYANADVINEDKEDLDQLRAEITSWAGFDHARAIRSDLPDKLYRFLERLLSVDLARRPSAEEVLNGIQVGANSNENFRFRKTSSTSSDLPGARIRPLDSPQPSVERALSPTKTLRRSPVSFRRDSMFDSSGFLGSPAPVSDPNPDESLSSAPDRDMVVRHRYSRSHSSSPAERPREPSPDLDSQPESEPVPQQHLLPPPPGRFPQLGSLAPLTSFLPSSILQLSLFLVKVISLLHPCSPLAVNPWVLYPLLLSAAFTLSTRNTWAQVLAAVLHILVVGLAYRLGGLCIWHRSSARDL
jgi:serine/threonine protein kinase